MERDIFEKVAADQGWNADTCVEVLLTYIERQQSPEAFVSFLEEQKSQENGT